MEYTAKVFLSLPLIYRHTQRERENEWEKLVITQFIAEIYHFWVNLLSFPFFNASKSQPPPHIKS